MAAALLLSTLPLIIASIVLPTQVEATLRKTGQDYLALAAKDLVALTQRELSGHLEFVRSLAEIDSFRSSARHNNQGCLSPKELGAVQHQIAALLRQRSGGSCQSIFMCGLDGRAYAGMLAAPENEPYPGISLHDRDYFLEARSSLQAVISDPIRSRVHDVPVVAVVAPFLDDNGSFAGIVGLAIQIDHLSTLISAQKIGATGYPFAVDKQGVIFAHPDPARRFATGLRSIPGAEHLADRMLRGEAGIEGYVSSRGVEKVAAFAPVPLNGWSIAASIETSEYTAPARRLRSVIFAMIAACVVAAVIVAIGFSIGLEDLKAALGRAHRNEMELGAIYSHVPVMILLLDAEGKVLRTNRAAQEFSGCCELSALGRRTGDLLGCICCLDDSRGCGCGPFCAACALNALPASASARTSASSRVEVRLRLVRGSETSEFVFASSTAALRLDGNPMSLLCLEDVTHQKRAEERVHDQAALLEVTQDAIFVLDLDGQITFWNRGAENIFGWRKNEVIGRSLGTILRTSTGQGYFSTAIREIWEKEEWASEVRLPNRTGETVVLQSRASLVRDAGGDPRAMLVVSTDVTEAKQIEAQFLRAQRLESLGALASGVAHDLNNVLAPILIGAELLRPLATKAEDVDMLRALSDSANRGAGIVRQLLLFGRGSTGPRVAVDLSDTLAELERITRRTFPKNIDIRFERGPSSPRVMADPTQLQQVFLNLGVNARDAMASGGTLTIVVSTAEVDEGFVRSHPESKVDTYAVVKFIDTGTGIPSSILDRIFDPFFTTKPPGSGTGLGLSTVLGIVSSHGGFITVQSTVEVGTEFRVYLPVLGAEEHASVESARVTEAWNGQGELVLLVDDDHAIRAVLRHALEAANYRVLLAHDGVEALRLYGGQESPVRAAIVDMLMPVMAGQETIDGLRRLSPRVPIIALSGSPDLEQTVREIDRPGVAFLAKPFTVPALLGLLQTAIQDRALC